MTSTSAARAHRLANGLEPLPGPLHVRAGRIGRAVQDGRDAKRVAAQYRIRPPDVYETNERHATAIHCRRLFIAASPDVAQRLIYLALGKGPFNKAPVAVQRLAMLDVLGMAGIQLQSGDKDKSLNEMDLSELQAFIKGGAQALEALQFQQAVAEIKGDSGNDQPNGDAIPLNQQARQSDEQSGSLPVTASRRGTVGLE